MKLIFNSRPEICACCGKESEGVQVEQINLCYYCNTSRAICEANARLKVGA